MRRAVANALYNTCSISESMQIMGHQRPSTFAKFYRTCRSKVDIQGLFHSQPGRTVSPHQHNVISANRNPNAPTNLPEDIKQELRDNDPKWKELKDIYEKQPRGSEKRMEAGKNLYVHWERIKRNRLEQFREDWFKGEVARYLSNRAKRSTDTQIPTGSTDEAKQSASASEPHSERLPVAQALYNRGNVNIPLIINALIALCTEPVGQQCGNSLKKRKRPIGEQCGNSLKRKRPKAKDMQKAQDQKLDEQYPAIEIAHYYWSSELRKFITEPITESELRDRGNVDSN